MAFRQFILVNLLKMQIHPIFEAILYRDSLLERLHDLESYRLKVQASEIKSPEFSDSSIKHTTQNFKSEILDFI